MAAFPKMVEQAQDELNEQASQENFAHAVFFPGSVFVSDPRAWPWRVLPTAYPLDLMGNYVLAVNVVQPQLAVQRDDDFYAWCVDQASALRDQRIYSVDWPHLAEELETMGAAEKRDLRKALRNLFLHLVKWQYQPERRSASWRRSINNRRDEIKDFLDLSPSLTTEVDARFAEAYERGRRDAIAEAGLHQTAVPTSCPWTREQVLDWNFWPGPRDSHSTRVVR